MYKILISMLKFQCIAESGIEYWKNLLNWCHNFIISQNPASDIEKIAYIDASISIFRRIRHRILKKSLISMPKSRYFAESGIGYWRNRLNRCHNLNISQNPASKIEEIFYIDATISIFRRIRHRKLKKSLKSMPQSQYFTESGIENWRNLLYRCWRSS